jgi:hypothetical protein
MGYYTSFKTTFIEVPSREVGVEARKAFEQFPFDGYERSMENMYADWTECFKWYDHEQEMIEFSKFVPEIVIKLHGIGEEQGDEWYKYFKNGKMQVCRAIITFDPYDETKLK